MRPTEFKVTSRCTTFAEDLSTKTPRAVSIVVSAYSDQVVEDTARRLIYTGSTLGKEIVHDLDGFINRICEKIDRLNKDKSESHKVYVDAREVLEASKHLINSPMDAASLLEGKPIERNQHSKNHSKLIES